MTLNLEEVQTSLTNLMEKQHGKVRSENGENEQGLMESTKIRKGNPDNDGRQPLFHF